MSPELKSKSEVKPLSISENPPMTTFVMYFNQLLRRALKRPAVSEPADETSALSNELGEYESESVQKTLDPNFVHPKILEARQIQDRIIQERFQGQSLRIADIGCGDGYHGETFGSDSELYHGFEISSEMASKTRKRWQDQGFDHSQVFEGDAGRVDLPSNFYDVAWSLYFTSGNFREEFKNLKQYDDAYLDKNPAFVRIVNNFYKALRPGGKLFLTVYKDKPETEAAQREFYKMTGQTVVTPLGSRFVATKENFWSVRWTEQSMLSNLAECGIKPEQVQFNDLNEVSWLVEITRPVQLESLKEAA